MGSTDVSGSSAAQHGTDRGASGGLPRFLDWLTPFVMVLLGFAFVLGGAAMLVVFDMTLLTTMVREGSLRSDIFSQNTLAFISYSTVQWGGIGAILTGGMMWVAAAVFRRAQWRFRSSPDVGTPPMWTVGLVGGVVTFVFGFIPLSPLLGGGVAGYLYGGQRGAAIRVGGLSGLFAAIPVAAVVLFLFGGMAAAAMRLSLYGGVLFGLGAIVFTLVLTVALQVGLGAVGGLVGAHFAPSRERHG